MEELNFLSQAIIDKNRESIENIIYYYGEENESPAYIRIETGTYDRLIINPLLELIMYFKLIGAEDRISSFNVEKEIKIGNFDMESEEFWTNACDPYTLCLRMHGKDSEEYKLLKSLSPFMGLVVIDYEAEGIREKFKPVVISLET